MRSLPDQALVKNCPRFHPHVAEETFMRDLVLTVPRKVREPAG
jgi:hypothetical protein